MRGKKRQIRINVFARKSTIFQWFLYMTIPEIKSPVVIFWFRRDLRLGDNAGLYAALRSDLPVLPLFIFDKTILKILSNKGDARVTFIHQQLSELNYDLSSFNSSILALYGNPVDLWENICSMMDIKAVFVNRDYEPYARERDEAVKHILANRNIEFREFKDQVIFEPAQVVKDDGLPYSVFTPYRNKWLRQFTPASVEPTPSNLLLDKLLKFSDKLLTLKEIGFRTSKLNIPKPLFNFEIIKNYQHTRDYPAVDGVSRLGVHFRFGTLSIREAVRIAGDLSETWLNELIWREFFMTVLYHHPQTIDQPFRSNYANLPWNADDKVFENWKQGLTGFPIVDAGMRELNATGYMHNRVRMITANFLTKLLRVDWRLGERWFAEKLLDFELSSNVGNWQWAAGCGCDAAPYFRIFNPWTQQQKFDADKIYIKKWLPEYGTRDYPAPMIDYSSERKISLDWFKHFLN